ncbi:hemerythrin domain-containing protein [Neobacillus mesonae]|uniref:hemerythrin domain-containing protein n=1 Tax=Neobacillus mesonae TaxID=1193713 RepID=UPI0020421449|nr:hemerythrin domain-containing protein [Neobacillus mesonae]MCM3571087.1 hemerythrin domain-containing protein [Neobacillus mesonae]
MQGCHGGVFGNDPVTLSEGLNKLVSEHIPLRENLQTLFSLCQKVEVEQGALFGELVQEVKDFSTKLDYHSKREEDILFRMMEVYLGKNGGPIAVMEYEHEQAHGYISEFLKNVESHSEFSTDEKIKNANLIENAYHTLISHFGKEEQVLYPMAERMFTDEEKEIVNQKVSVER